MTQFKMSIFLFQWQAMVRLQQHQFEISGHAAGGNLIASAGLFAWRAKDSQSRLSVSNSNILGQ